MCNDGSEHAPGIRYLPYRSYFWMVFIRRRTVVLVGKRRIQEMAGIEGEYRWRYERNTYESRVSRIGDMNVALVDIPMWMGLFINVCERGALWLRSQTYMRLPSTNSKSEKHVKGIFQCVVWADVSKRGLDLVVFSNIFRIHTRIFMYNIFMYSYILPSWHTYAILWVIYIL